MKEESKVDSAVLTLQSWWRGEKVRTTVRKLAKHMLKRRYLIRELI